MAGLPATRPTIRNTSSMAGLAPMAVSSCCPPPRPGSGAPPCPRPRPRAAARPARGRPRARPPAPARPAATTPPWPAWWGGTPPAPATRRGRLLSPPAPRGPCPRPAGPAKAAPRPRCGPASAPAPRPATPHAAAPRARPWPRGRPRTCRARDRRPAATDGARRSGRLGAMDCLYEHIMGISAKWCNARTGGENHHGSWCTPPSPQAVVDCGRRRVKASLFSRAVCGRGGRGEAPAKWCRAARDALRPCKRRMAFPWPSLSDPHPVRE